MPVKIDLLQYGNKSINNSAVLSAFLDAIINKKKINVNNTTMGGDPLPGVVKNCVITWRYFDNSGISATRTIREGTDIDFAEPEIVKLEYGGVNIMGRANVVSGLKFAIKAWKRVYVSNANLGGDTRVGVQKEFAITYRRFPGWPLTQFIVKEGESIYFERQIQAIFYGGVLLFDKPFVYASFNRAFRDNFLDPTSDNNLGITNENLGGDPAPGVRKTCTVEIDGWDSWCSQPMFIPSTFNEGDAWPRQDGAIPGVYSVTAGKGSVRRWAPAESPYVENTWWWLS